MPSVSEPSTNAELKTILAEMNALNLDREDDRRQMVFHAQGIVNAFQNPVARAFELMFSSTVLPCARVAVDLNLFQLISAEPMTAGELAMVTNAEELLIVRVARVLVAAGVIKADEDGRYSSTAVSNIFCLPSLTDGLKTSFDLIYFPCAFLPGLLRDNNFANPTDPLKTAYQLAYQTDKHFFDHIAQPLPEPERLSIQFNNFMTAFRAAKPPWTKLISVQDTLVKGAKPDTPLLVDIGGGSGHDLELFKREVPDFDGKLVLQDQPSLLSGRVDYGLLDNKEKAGFEVMEHDFFTPQPIKGARCYFLKSVLHDWPDRDALRILQNIVPVMEENYSKLLIVDNIFPDDGGLLPLASAGLDISAMAQHASLERTETMWRGLLKQAGLHVEDLWKARDGDGIICCSRLT